MRITFIGSNYGNTPIVVEYIDIGGLPCSPSSIPSLSGGTDYRVAALPKKYVFGGINETNNYFNKILNLSNFVINSGDYLVLEVIPNPTQNQTSWDFYFTCLENFNC